MKQAVLLLFILVSFGSIASAQSHEDFKVDTIDLTTQSSGSTQKIFTAVQSNPAFPGGEQEFYKYLGQNIHVPAYLYIHGDVLMLFCIDTDGRVIDPKILKGIVTEGMKKEIIRVFNESPKWQPAIQNSKPVKTYITVPIKF
jgi:protein TonB